MHNLFKRFILTIVAMVSICGLIDAITVKADTNGKTIYKSEISSTFDPGGATYSRIICLKNNGSSNGVLLCTFDQLKKVLVDIGNGQKILKQVYPIYRSSDGGESWELISNVYDREFGLMRTSQPCIYELPKQVGDMPAGTILLAGNIFDDSPFTQSRIVIYKSLDGGYTWSFLSQVDNGGPCKYDPSTSSTTTSVWEPFLNIGKDGKLVCYYSDERQKSKGILQAVSFKTSSDGKIWSSLKNVTAITNKNDRPGMITVSALPNGKYIATYEVVNRPSISRNNAVVYCKFSNDGVTWDAGSLGTRVSLADGRGIGSSPYVKWVDAGGPNGMVIISAKWATDSKDNISGGQNFYVNYNLGEGTWERLPMAVTYDADDNHGGYFSGFSQSFDVSIDNNILYHATNVENIYNKKKIDGSSYNLNDIKIGKIPLNGTIYEAEKATLSNIKVEDATDASNGKEVRYINELDSSVDFKNIKVAQSGDYDIMIRYSNGTGKDASHSIYVNGLPVGKVDYPASANWDRYLWAEVKCYLKSGLNTVKFIKDGGYAELDCILVDDYKKAFVIQNKNSNKYLEIKNALVTENSDAGQWGVTDNWCQKWIFESSKNGYFRIKNINSGLYLDIQNQGKGDGDKVIQKRYNNASSQLWKLVLQDDGYYFIINKNSGKYLEVAYNSIADGAKIGQWGPTGYDCQKWILKKEGIN